MHCPWDKLESLISKVEMEQQAPAGKLGATGSAAHTVQQKH
jgi:hypothetical protein